jgi:hypothetical protein
MAKRKVTVSIDEELVSAVQGLGRATLSGVINVALAAEVDRQSRAAALKRLLDQWDARFGPVSDAATDAARAAFDDVDAVAVLETTDT